MTAHTNGLCLREAAFSAGIYTYSKQKVARARTLETGSSFLYRLYPSITNNNPKSEDQLSRALFPPRQRSAHQRRNFGLVRRLESDPVLMLVLVLVVSDQAFVLTQGARKVTSRTAKRDVRCRRRSGKADEWSGRWQRVGAVPVPVTVLLVVVMVRMLVFRIVVVVVRMVRTGMVAIIGEGVIITGQ